MARTRGHAARRPRRRTRRRVVPVRRTWLSNVGPCGSGSRPRSADGSARPRDFTDDAVRQPAGAASGAARPAAPAPAAASKPTAELERRPKPPVPAAPRPAASPDRGSSSRHAAGWRACRRRRQKPGRVASRHQRAPERRTTVRAVREGYVPSSGAYPDRRARPRSHRRSAVEGDAARGSGFAMPLPATPGTRRTFVGDARRRFAAGRREGVSSTANSRAPRRMQRGRTSTPARTWCGWSTIGYRRWTSSVRVVAGRTDECRRRWSSNNAMNAVLALEDGTWYRGVAAGAHGEARGEVVFNTSMTGYQEVLTDPVVRRPDRHDDLRRRSATTACRRATSSRARRRSPASSSARRRRWPATGARMARCATISSRHNIVAIADIDTRALTRKLRSAGVMRGDHRDRRAVDPTALVETGARRFRRWKAPTWCAT